VYETAGVAEFLVAEKKINNKHSQAVTKCMCVSAVGKGTETCSS